MKQFLLNKDGSVPSGADVAALLAAGLRLVIPTDMPIPGAGKICVDTEPKQINGIWYQQWIEIDAPVVDGAKDVQ